ncbi:MAG: hypothetical protein IPG09_09035 [Ignavibacteria bacterium]|nr:hypothetical protein [Ignavibacteria bacterium]
MLNKPLNIYEIFFGLSNYKYEACEIEDDKALEEARELIYYFLSNPKLNAIMLTLLFTNKFPTEVRFFHKDILKA